MSRSFRFQLAARFTVGMAAAVVAIGVVSVLAIRSTLDRELKRQHPERRDHPSGLADGLSRRSHALPRVGSSRPRRLPRSVT